VARTFPEAPLRVQRRARDGALTPIPEHPLAALVARPNPYYAGPLLWQATLADYVLFGNAYWAKVRSGPGRPTELWWLPAQTVRVEADEDSERLVDFYEYTPSGTRAPVRLDPADVVHFRYGLDPADPRRGLSPVTSVLREVLTDDEAARFSASLLRNMAIPGVIISPSEPVSQADAEAVKAKYRDTFGGSRRGDVLVMRGPSTVAAFSFNPQQMDLKTMRTVPEERICAVLGVSPMVVGLGAGLSSNTFSNQADAREAAYEGCLIPTQRLLAAELHTQLLGDFVERAQLPQFVVDFDLTQVRVLQPDLDKLWTRLDVGVRGGWVSPNEARAQVGLNAVPDGDVFYVPSSLVPTATDALLVEPAPEEEPLALPSPVEEEGEETAEEEEAA
jgi:HK97 family phage portal protein